MDAKYSVFGSLGFIGSHLAKDSRCIPVETSREDRGIIQFPTNRAIFLRSTVHNYHPKDGDVFTDVETNLLHMLQTLKSGHDKFGKDFEFIYISTWFVYGNAFSCHPSEMDICNPSGFYSITKYAAEMLIRSYCETNGIKYKIIRLANVLGIGDEKASKRKNALQYMVKTLCEGGTIDLYIGDFYRDYLHVSDAVSGILSVAERGNSGEIYNVGSGKGSIVSDLVYYAQDKIKSRGLSGGLINLVEPPDFHKIVQTHSLWLDIRKVCRDTQWQPKKSAIECIDEIVDYYTEGVGKNGH